jgi:large conductance mechanosensitive channel
MDFKDLFVVLNNQTYPNLDTAKKAGAPVIAYGNFINTIINFLIVAFAIFLLVKQVNRLKKPEPAPAAPATKDCPYCAMSIPAKASRCPLCTSELRAGSAHS